MGCLPRSQVRDDKLDVRAQQAMQSGELLGISYIQAFVKVAECGSIAHASKKLCLSPSSVSRSIQQIEKCLGVPLLERRPHGSLLSSYGLQILPRAQRAIKELGAIGRKTKAATSEHVGSQEHLLNTHRLQMFVKLCEQRHMPSVAIELGLSQPAISLGVKILEGGVGSILFERTALGLVPNRRAIAMDLSCRRALNELRHIPAEIAALRGSAEGVVTIGMISLDQPHILPQAIAETVTLHPGLQIATREDPFEEMVSGLLASDIDFIFGPLSLPNRRSQLRTETLFEEKMVLLVGQGNPLLRKRVVLKDLMNARWVLPRNDAPVRLLLNSAFRKAGMSPPSPTVESGDLATIRELLARTDMLTAVLSHQMANEIAEGRVQRLPHMFRDTAHQIGFLYSVESTPSPGAQIMINAIRSIAKKQG